MWGRTVTIGSAGKTFAFTGWKVGWATGPAELVTAVRTAKQFLTYVGSGPFQYAIAEALALPPSYVEGLRDELRARRDQMCDGLRSLGFEVYPPHGTYFVTTDVRPLGHDDGVAFCRELPHRCGVVAIPHAVFYDDVAAGRPLVRWAFCKREAVIDEALGRLERLSVLRP
jgi:N-succinyldiaminopimelate aminotransferase